MNFGGGADTIQPPRSGSRSHLSSSEHSTWSSEPSGGRDEVDVNRQLQEGHHQGGWYRRGGLRAGSKDESVEQMREGECSIGSDSLSETCEVGI